MRAQFTSYAVPGWGVGELWSGEDVVLAHEFRFEAAAEGARPPDVAVAAPPMGARAPLPGTVAGTSQRVGDGLVSTSHQPPPRHAAPPPDGRAAGDVDPDELAVRFTAFFAGADDDFRDVPIDLEWATPFQRALADALRGIRRGAVVSYGELASLAGRPRAARAAGSFCATNRFMLILPCHRVVGASGLGGYGSAGLRTKRRLLALEGVAA